jgi:glutathione peroxidase
MKLILFFLLSIHSLFSISIYDFKVNKINGEEISLSEFKGKNLLIVNVASQCGYTYQYDGLEKLYQEYKAKNFEILAFPSNDFGAQEPGSNQEIAKFCKLNYNVSFSMMSKIIVSGKNKNPLYKYLVEETKGKEIGWNFEKFIINKNGLIVNRFASSIEPLSKEIKSTIEKLK